MPEQARSRDDSEVEARGGPATFPRDQIESGAGTARVYLTPSDVAALLQLSVASIYRLAADPKARMPSYRLPGGTLRFRRDKLEAWLESHETGKRQALRLSRPA